MKIVLTLRAPASGTFLTAPSADTVVGVLNEQPVTVEAIDRNNDGSALLIVLDAPHLRPA